MPEVILASQSKSRADILRGVKLPFDTQPAHIDEEGLRASFRVENMAISDQAMALAETKALKISRKTNAYVIGADQILECEGRAFDKSADLETASKVLEFLRGRTHYLQTAICVAKEGAIIWRHLARPELHMRHFSDPFLKAYLEAEGDDVLSSVGCYKLEGRGAQLFTHINGDYFSILGLPLFPLMDFLRLHKVVAT